MSTYPASADPDLADLALARLDAAVFDLDGVLTRTATLHAAAWQRALDEAMGTLGGSIEPFDLERDYTLYLDGRPRLDGVAAYVRARGTHLPIGDAEDPPGEPTQWGVSRLKNEYFHEEITARGVEVFDDAVSAVHGLRSHGLRLAVVTASENGHLVLRHAGLAGQFDVVLTGVEARRWSLAGKPAPDMFLRAATTMAIPATRTLVLEDAVAGVHAGRAGGFGLVVGVDRAGHAEQLALNGAHAVLDELTDLMTLTEDSLARSPGPLLEQRFEAFLLLPGDGDVNGEQLQEAAWGLRATGALVEIAGEDPTASAEQVVRRAAGQGITPGLILALGWPRGLTLPETLDRVCVVSVAPRPGPADTAASNGDGRRVSWLGGGAEALFAVLHQQEQRRGSGRVPGIDLDPAWTVVVRGDDPRPMQVQQSLLTVADTRFGTRGVREEDPSSHVPAVLAGGVYDETTAPTTLTEAPGWTGLEVQLRADPARDLRVLDLRSGLLYREQGATPVPLRSMRFASLARPGVQALRAEGSVDWLHAGPALSPPASDGTFVRRQQGQASTATSQPESGGTVAAAAEHREWVADGREFPVRIVERLAGLAASPDPRQRPAVAAQSLAEAQQVGFERLLTEQRRAWARRWDDAEVSIDGDPEAERAVRFALFHLMAAAPTSGEAAIGPRGLSGPTYRGHVFWDADVFVLPFLAATCPDAALAMLRYRLRRLPAARQAARSRGLQGAQFPWESARTGLDVTPSEYVEADGTRVPILTGQLEEHITADIAWAAAHYLDWTGRNDLLRGPVRHLLADTARYWASRVRLDSDGRGHIDAVIGPDEYHELVDDNAFTNVMARWNLRRAADLADPLGVEPAEARHWRDLAGALVDNFDPTTGRYEQFTGYYQLEPTRVADVARAPVAADLLFSRERLTASQLIKQPDVLMLHHLVPEETQTDSLAPNLDYYEPRCTHGSSLSPAIHASLMAREGRTEEALRLFRMSCRLDLDNLTGTTAGGLHMATFGGLWQALVFGFAGVRPQRGVLTVDPRLPDEWSELRVRMRVRGTGVQLTASSDRFSLQPDGSVDVEVPGSGPMRVGPAGRTWDRTTRGWRAR